MRARRLGRDDLSPGALEGSVLARTVRDRDGRIVFGKGMTLAAADLVALEPLPWTELHVVVPDPGDLHEVAAGERLAHLAAGEGVVVGGAAGGHWSLKAAHRGLFEVRRDALAAVNGMDGLAVYTLPGGQVVDGGETLAGAKIVPFLIRGAILDAAASAAGGEGLLRVRPFRPAVVSAVVLESLGATALRRFGESLGEKVGWFGSSLRDVRCVPPDAGAVVEALVAAISGGAGVVVVAGSAAMDPLDPAFEALRRVGARIERHGVPAHPGSLFWMARAAEIPVVGMPSCGLFSRATVFDLVLPRLLAGAPVDASWLASLGDGGLLTRDTGSRFPPYRTSHDRGAIG
jgi:hypothetical protein